MSPDPVFVDTWGWMALGHRRDPSHSEIRRFYHELREQEDEHFLQVGMGFSKVPPLGR